MSTLKTRIPRPGVSVEGDVGDKENVGATTVQKTKGSITPSRHVLSECRNGEVSVRKSKRGKGDGDAMEGQQEKKGRWEDVPVSDSGKMHQVPEEELAMWADVLKETGWEERDCLLHKLSLPKRGDPAKKVSMLGQHVKRLRSLGWRLYADRKEALIECRELEKSEMAARGELGSAKGQLERVQSELDEEVAASRRALSEQKEEIKTLTEKISEIDAKLKEVTEERNGLEDEVESYHMTKANLEKKLQDAEAAQMESQKYSMNLQEYNSKLQGEVQNLTQQMDDLRGEKARLTEDKASLTGRVQALGDALEALQASSSSTEKARKDAVAELSRLRGELASLSAEKSSLTAELSTVKGVCNEQRSDLERYRAATGKDLAALEEEKANSHMLTQRTKAQAETVAALQDQLTMMKEQRTAAEAHAERLSEENRGLKAKIAEFEVLLPAMEERVRDSEAIRRRLHNTVLELKGNVRVFCRVRPLSQEEEDAREKTSLVPVSTGDLSGRGLELENANSSTKPSVSQDKNQQQKHLFTFDRTFGPTSTQEDVFEEVSMLVQSALDGYRVCIFAYGQTGSGKTHTMLGNPDNEGIIPRSVRQIFTTAEKDSERGWRYVMKASMLEIYNEDIKDLLGPGPPEGKKHIISSTDTGEAAGVEVSYLEWKHVSCSDDVSSLLKKAMKERSVGATACNAQSSRSHMVFMLAVEGTNEATGQKLSGALNLVDLAGSERVGKSEVTGDRLKETQAINKSLSALGDVIAALGTKEHVPYRNSKLTFLLQNSLSGSGKALMLCNVGPSSSASNETLCTLRFASKVNATNIGTARRNIR